MFQRSNSIIILLFVISLSVTSCFSDKQKVVIPAVYHWKSVFNLQKHDIQWLNENHIQRIYLRVFDVDWNESIKEPVPIGDVQVISTNLQTVVLIPTVFITNKTFLHIPDSSLSTLALNITNKINAKMAYFQLNKFNEIQLDCDWSEKTRDKYFQLIRLVRSQSENKMISATIRLHQVKYFEKTGVPPADRGMLMFYNMGSVEDASISNSIFDIETAKKYMFNFDSYPLKLDVVLPAFSWGSLFRSGKIIKLLNELTRDQLLTSKNFSEISSNKFICNSPFIVNGNRILKNDFIRIETIDNRTTESAADMISEHISGDTITVALYHLNKELIKNYEKAILKNIYSHFN